MGGHTFQGKRLRAICPLINLSGDGSTNTQVKKAVTFGQSFRKLRGPEFLKKSGLGISLFDEPM
jgi:hypothetical protein